MQFERDLVSVIVTTYNSQDTIEETLKSICSQSYKKFEIILVDDCSFDKTINVVNKICCDSTLRIYVNTNNRGPGFSRNRGLGLSRGEFIAFCDGDDVWRQDKLHIQLAYMRRNTFLDGCTSDYVRYDHRLQNKLSLVKTQHRPGLLSYLKNTNLGFSTSFFKRDVFDRYQFTEDRTRQDLILWIKLLKDNYSIGGIDRSLVKYRVHRNGISSNKIRASLKTLRVYLKYSDLPFYQSLLLFFFKTCNNIKLRVFNSQINNS